MVTTIRRGRRGDAAFLARVMLSASRAHLPRGIWDLRIGADEAGCLTYLQRLAVTEPRSLCHYESFLIAEGDGKPGAALCAFNISAAGWAAAAEAMSSVERDLRWTDADRAASEQRMAPVWAWFLPDIGADWGIENVAALPEYRRRGLVTALLNEALRHGHEHGCKLAQITTFIGNDSAQAAYMKSGFRVSDERRTSEMESVLGAPGFRRLVREL